MNSKQYFGSQSPCHRLRCRPVIGISAALVVLGCSPSQQASTVEGTTPKVWTGSPLPLTHGETPGDPGHSPGGDFITAGLSAPDGSPVGTVTFVQGANHVEVQTQLTGPSPGTYRLVIHEVGECDAASTASDSNEGSFMSAGDPLSLPDGDPT